MRENFVTLIGVGWVLMVFSCAPVQQIPEPIVQVESVVELPETRFGASGFSFPQQMSRGEPGVVVRFDTQPTTMEFRVYARLRTENGIGYHNGYAETYYPISRNPLSFEMISDREGRYARAWIETQSNARIVVRIRGALCDRNYIIAHSDIPSGSPYGKGDWVDEWYHIYPDAVHVRMAKIYTGTALESQPFGFERYPPKIIHEFQETSINGVSGHLPDEDVELGALTLIRMNGENTTISWESSYPLNYGEFRNANIQVINLKSKYKPFTVAFPDGVTLQPYNPEGDLPYKFQVWTRDITRGYSIGMGHIINWKHYEKTENTLTNIYLTGMTDALDPVKELVPIARSWLQPPELRLSQESESLFKNEGYDKTQRAFVISYKGKNKPSKVEFTIDANEDSPIVNPALVLKNYGRWYANLEINGEKVNRSQDHRQGAEFHHPVGTDIIIWLKYKSDKPITVSITPGGMVL